MRTLTLLLMALCTLSCRAHALDGTGSRKETAAEPESTKAASPESPRVGGELPASRDRAPAAISLPASIPEAKGCSNRCDNPPLLRMRPELKPVDREVLGMCPARPDASVSRGDVQRFMSAHYDDPRIQRALSVAGRPGSREGNIEWLTSLWVSTGPRNAFTHVFCGDDWLEQKVGGLHYLPRYAQLESEGKLCFDGPAREGTTALLGSQYLIRYHGVAPWSCAEKKIGGIPLKEDPVAMVAIGTRAFARCCGRDAKKDGGVYSTPDLGGNAWRIWCGTRNGTYGISTLYPSDEQPTCGD